MRIALPLSRRKTATSWGLQVRGLIRPLPIPSRFHALFRLIARSRSSPEVRCCAMPPDQAMQTRSARHNLRTPATITSRTLCRAGPVLGRRGLVCSPCCQADRSSSHRQGRRRPNNMSAFVSRPFNHSLNSCSNACHGCFGFPLGPPGSGRYPQIASRNCATGRPCAFAVLKRDCSDARSCGSSKATYPPMT